MPYDERWLADVLARGHVRLLGAGGAGARGRDPAPTPDLARPPCSEQAFMAAVIRVAKEHSWLCYHTHDSRRSLPGYPDLTLVRPPHGGRPGEAIWAECKVPGGRLTLQQAHWLEVLGQVERTEAVVWVPEAMPEIVERLTD